MKALTEALLDDLVGTSSIAVLVDGFNDRLLNRWADD